MNRVGRHATWLAPLAVALAAWGLLVWMADHEVARHGPTDGGGLVVAAVGLFALAVTVGGIVMAVRNGRRCWRRSRAARRATQQRSELSRAYSTAFAQARTLAEGIVTGKSLMPLTVWGLVLRPSETAYLDLTVGVSQLSTLPSGQCVWTAPLQAQLIASDQRLLVGAARWLSVRYDTVTGFYPELDCGRLTLDVEAGLPLLLTGPASAIAAVWLASMLYGREGMRRHPALTSLLA
jgi:hypothetical protein